MKTFRHKMALMVSALMLCGLTTLGASAAGSGFTDRDQITQTEAVEVMSALGVFQGSGGAFHPQNILTREQAAKIICHMLGVEVAPVEEALFADVSPDRWSAPYIAYCVEKGILSGDGSDSFHPDQPLTGGAFAKMLLVGLGYDPEIEGYTGSDWLLSVASTAVALEIAPKDMNLLDPLSRQDAAQMCYQTLTCDMVRYRSVNDLFTDRPAVGKVENYYEQDYNDSGDNIQQFCEAYFPALEQITAYDDFGRPSSCWLLDGALIQSTTHAPVAKLTGTTSAKTISTQLGSYALRDSSFSPLTKRLSDTRKSTFTAKFHLTVADAAATTTMEAVRIHSQSPADYLAALTGNGRQVEIFANEKNVITDIVVTSYTVDTVTGVTVAPGKTAYTVGGKSYLDVQEGSGTDTAVLHGEIKVGDTVTYTVANGVAYLYPTSLVEGTLTAVRGERVEISGLSYPLGSGVAGVPDLTPGAQAVFCLDQFGNVVDLRTANRTVGYAQILEAVPTGRTMTVTAVTAAGQVEQHTLALRTLTRADLFRGQSYAANQPKLRLEPGDVVVGHTNILVTDASSGASYLPQAAAALPGVWAYVLEGDTMRLQPLSPPSDSMAEYTPYLDSDVTFASLPGTTQREDYLLSVDNNTWFVQYNAGTGQAICYQGAYNLPEGMDLPTSGDVVGMGYDPNQGVACVIFSTIPAPEPVEPEEPVETH